MTGTLRALGHGADQALAAARHAEIHVLRERKQLRDRLAIGGGHDLNGVFGKLCAACVAPASIIVSAMIWLEFIASLPPRRIVALPDLKQRLAASAVTFGRDS